MAANSSSIFILSSILVSIILGWTHVGSQNLQHPTFVKEKGEFIRRMEKEFSQPGCTLYNASPSAIYFEQCFQGTDDTPFSVKLNGIEAKRRERVEGGVLATWPDDVTIQEGKQSNLLVQEEENKRGISIVFVFYLPLPREKELPEFSRLAHELKSGNITILNARTFYVPRLYYDGTGPDAYFWVGNGSKGPDENGRKIPNEKGSLGVLSRYDGESIVLTLPEDLTVYDIDYLGIWCVQYKHNFGYVNIPHDHLKVPPPFYTKEGLKLGRDDASSMDETAAVRSLGKSISGTNLPGITMALFVLVGHSVVGICGTN